MIHPIGFSIPKEKLVQSIPKKTTILATSIPGQLDTYIFNKEEDYYNDYKQSIFAITTKKAGWDCMRHYEILANGCIPFFPTIEKCPRNTMGLWPKNLLVEANRLYNKLGNNVSHKNEIHKRYVNKLKTMGVDECDPKILNECTLLITKLLDYTRTYLTTEKVARYVLEKSGKQTASTILFLSGNTDPDYLRCLTLHGLKQLFGTKCHDYPKVAHLYTSDTIDYTQLYGKGMTYSNLLSQLLHDDTQDLKVEEHIKNRTYDLIIYGSYHRGMPYYKVVTEYYKPEDIVLLCGEDIHECNYKDWVKKGHCVFVRELE
jgi:hypothetical protein